MLKALADNIPDKDIVVDQQDIEQFLADTRRICHITIIPQSRTDVYRRPCRPKWKISIFSGQRSIPMVEYVQPSTLFIFGGTCCYIDRPQSPSSPQRLFFME